VSLVVTELGVFSIDGRDGLTLIELMESVTLDQVRERTGAPFAVRLAAATP
jgi:3-oxoacid CoA-transferase subunit B